MHPYRSVRLGSLIAGDRRADIVTRYPAPDDSVRARPMRVGARMLETFGMHDDWLPAHGDFLSAYGSQVHVIPEALVLSATGIVGLRTGEVIEDTLDHTDPERDGYEREGEGIVRLRAPQTRLGGRYLSLLLGNYENHFHFLLMNLARMALLEPGDLEGLDGILVPADLAPSQHEAIELAKLVRHAPLRTVRRGEGLEVETLVLPWNVASGHGVNPEAVSWLRGLFPRPARRPGRRIYIDRSTSPLRRLLNEAEIIDVLRGEGVEPVRTEGLSLSDQAMLLQDAELVVGPHGAGLTNMVFAEPETHVIEILPSGNMNWCYRHLAAACGHDYDCVIGRSQPQDEIAPIWASWVVSPTHVLSAVHAALGMWI